MLDPSGKRFGGGSEKRKAKRASMNLNGVLFFPGRDAEGRCDIVDFSPHGAGLKFSGSAPVGTKAVLYVDGFGRIEGMVIRRDRTRLAMEFHCSAMKRSRIVEQLSGFVANGMMARVPLRTMARVTRVPEVQEIVTEEGERASCKVLDIALGGALLKTHIRPDVGGTIYFGETAGRVVRHTDEGIAVEFVRHSQTETQHPAWP
jgi:hypothetical protein